MRAIELKGGFGTYALVNIDKITHVIGYEKREEFPDHLSPSEVEAYGGEERINHPRMTDWGTRIYVDGGKYIECSQVKTETIASSMLHCPVDGFISLTIRRIKYEND